MKIASFLASLILVSGPCLHAQWTTESHSLNPGWTAIYPLNDTTHLTLDALFASQPAVTQVWRWVPSNLSATFITDPNVAVQGQEWRVWRRGDAANTTITHLTPNHGYLVYNSSASAITLSLTGKAILSEVQWRSSGANLVGFPAKTSPAPRFGGTTTAPGYLSAFPGFTTTTPVLHYLSGEISASNPAMVPALTTATITRGKAYWIDLKKFSDFVAPVKVEVDTGSGLHFGTRGPEQRLKVTNTGTVSNSVVIAPMTAAATPAGQQAVVAQVPLLLKTWDATELAYTYAPVGFPLSVALAPGESRIWTLVPNRAAMPAAVGSLYASVLQVTDNFADQRVPVTAVKAGHGGLWVGEAVVTQVQNQLQRFRRNADGTTYYNEAGEVELLDTRTDAAATAQPFTLRLIVHVDATGTARLLSNVYFGVLDDAQSTTGFATRQSALKPANIATASRITATHLPLDVVQTLAGGLNIGTAGTATISLPHTAPTNPFLHTYHPDHDNLDARFTAAAPLPAGRESHAVTRALSLTVDATAPPNDPAWGSSTLTGHFAETITGLHRSSIGVSGRFTLRRLSENTTLNQ